MSSGYVLGVLFSARRRIEDYVVDGLYELELHDALDEQHLELLVLHLDGHLEARYLGADVVVVRNVQRMLMRPVRHRAAVGATRTRRRLLGMSVGLVSILSAAEDKQRIDAVQWLTVRVRCPTHNACFFQRL